MARARSCRIGRRPAGGSGADERGRPVADVVKQEHYVEDQFSVTPALQKAVAKALARAGSERARLPDDFSKLCATHAHLGHIDVQPCLCMIPNKAENRGEWKHCELWARKVTARKDTVLWRVEGQSEVVSEVAINGKGVHDVKLTWRASSR